MKRLGILLLLIGTALEAQSGKVLRLDGVDDYAWLDQPLPDLPELTIEVWSRFEYSSLNNMGVIFMDATGDDANDLVLDRSGERIGIRADKSGARLNDEAALRCSEPVLALGWHHLAWVMTPTWSRIYLDGILETEVAETGSNVGHHAPRPTLGRWQAGSAAGWGGFYRGYLDDFRLWSRALSRDEIARGMSTPPGGSEPDLVLWYDFEDEGPQLADRSTQRRTASLMGGAERVALDLLPDVAHLPDYPEARTWTNGSLRLVGGQARGVIPDSRPWLHFSSKFTLELWVWLDRFVGEEWNTLLSNDEYELAVDTRNARLVTNGHGNWVRGLHHLTPGAWHHVAWVRDGAELRLYLDGLPDGPAAPADRSGEYSQSLWIGNDSTASSPYGRAVAGRIDEVRLWRIARTGEQIAADMQRSMPADTTGLNLHLSFDGVLDDGRVRDLTGHGLHALLVGGAAVDTGRGAPVDLPPADRTLSVSPDTVTADWRPTMSWLLIEAAAGLPAWSATVVPAVPWLRLAGFAGDSQDGELTGQGSERLALYTSGRGLAPGRYQTAIVVQGPAGRQEVPVVLQRAEGYPASLRPATSAGQALQLSSTATFRVDQPTALAGLTEFTIECWVYENGVRLDGEVLAVSDSVSQRLRLSRYEDVWRWRVDDSPFANPAVAEATFPAGTTGNWQHLAIVQQGDRVRFYTDGVLRGEQDGMRIRWHGPAYRLTVGRNERDRGYCLFAIDELRLWDEALSTEQLRSRMNTSLTGAEPGLVGYWRFDAAAYDGTLADLSGNGQRGGVWSMDQLHNPPPLEPSKALIGASGPVLGIAPSWLEFWGPIPQPQQLVLRNNGGGVLTWSLRSRASWLGLALSEDSTPQDRLDGEGPARLWVTANGQGLPAGTYRDTLRLESGTSVAEVPVNLTIAVGPILGPDDELVEAAEVPAAVWGSPFALPVVSALEVELDTVATILAAQSGSELRHLRVVAVRPDTVVYVAAEIPFPTNVSSSTIAARVWSSRDRGRTWSPVLRLDPADNCDYSTTIRAAALHPDGRRVFLGTTNGVYLDSLLVATPPQATAITALHVSADGRYLWLATEELRTVCEWPTRTLSVRGLYRATLEGGEMVWADATGPLSDALTPVVRLGSDPGRPAQVWLQAPSGVVYRTTLRSPAEEGWQMVALAQVPAGVSFDPGLNRAEEQLRVQAGYPARCVPSDADFRPSWLGLLFGRDGLAWGRYYGIFSHLVNESIVESRDAGLTWQNVWGRGGFGWGTGDLEPDVLAVDAQGLLGVTGTAMTGLPAIAVGPWNGDPVDPLTTYVGLRGRGLVYRTPDHGATWERLGQGLPPTFLPGAIAVDSTGVLYLRSGQQVWARRVADRAVQVAAASMVPADLSPGDAAVVTARLRPLPETRELPAGLAMQVTMTAQADPVPMRDDGVAPDAAAGDGVWTAAVAVPVEQAYGRYGAVITAAPTDRPATRASRRVAYQVVPSGDYTIFADEPGEDWTCGDATGQSVVSSQRVGVGQASMRIEREVTCVHDGAPLHPYSRHLELLVYAETGPVHLRIVDQEVPADSLPPGRWTRLRLPAESLTAGPGYADGRATAPDLGSLRFSSPTPVWLDEVRLVVDRSSAPTAVAEVGAGLPRTTRLRPPHPNPFNAGTTVVFELGRDGQARLEVYNLLGQRVRRLAMGPRAAGLYQLAWDGRDDEARPLASGVYLIRLDGPGAEQTVKVVLLR